MWLILIPRSQNIGWLKIFWNFITILHTRARDITKSCNQRLKKKKKNYSANKIHHNNENMVKMVCFGHNYHIFLHK